MGSEAEFGFGLVECRSGFGGLRVLNPEVEFGVWGFGEPKLSLGSFKAFGGLGLRGFGHRS